MSYSIMSELLQFMYQGEVNVKQAELQSFMSIAESLQIKGLATSTSGNSAQTVRTSDAVNSSYSQFQQANNVARNHNQHHFNSSGNHAENHRQTTSTPLSTSSSVDNNQSMKGENSAIIFPLISHSNQLSFRLTVKMGDLSPFGQKRTMDQASDRQSQMKIKRTINDISDSDMNDSIDNMTSDDMFLPQVMQPQVTINESPRFDANSVKREINDVQQPQSPNTTGFRGSYRKSFYSTIDRHVFSWKIFHFRRKLERKRHAKYHIFTVQFLGLR